MQLENSQDFLSLVRLGIGHQTSPVKIYDWPSIKALADEQELSAIIIDGIERLAESQHPPKEFILQWFGEVMHNYEYRYSDYERAIGDLAGFYEKHGIKMMVLKGYGLSLNYPTPKHRPCGDIDTWNFGKQEEADDVISKELGIPVDTSEHHHTVFYWKNYMVENHYDFLNTFVIQTNRELEPILKELAMDDSHFVEINNKKVYLPSANFNALFLLRHMLMHFVAAGINIRHLLDWAFFWEKTGDLVDWMWLNCILQKYSMMDFFHIINQISIENLGFDKKIFPETQSSKSYLKGRVLEELLIPETDKKDAHKPHLIPRLIFKLRRWRLNSWKRELCYNESNWSSFWSGVKSHTLKPSSI